MTSPPTNVPLNQASSAPQAKQQTAKRSWTYRTIPLVAGAIIVFAVGVVLGAAIRGSPSQRNFIHSAFARLTDSPIEYGICLFICAASLLILAFVFLLLVMGLKIARKAESLDDLREAWKLITGTLVKVLRALRRYPAFSQEPEDPLNTKDL